VRKVEPIGAPSAGDNTFELHWKAVYEKAGCPDLELPGFERATFEGDRIVLLEDIFEASTDERIMAYLDRYMDSAKSDA
jgi:hypothetical protein